jgi:hypothetical protein
MKVRSGTEHTEEEVTNWLMPFKTDAFGSMEWNKTYGGTSDDMAYDVQQTTDGGYIVCGHTYSFGMTLGDAWLFKTDAFGNVEWGYVSGWPDWDEAQSVQQVSEGGYIVAGRRYYVDRYDFWLFKTNSSGGIEWSKTYGGKMRTMRTLILFGKRTMEDT